MKKQEIPQTKKEISRYIHTLINKGYIEEAKSFLLQLLATGDRSTIILGSLINIYKMQGGRWQEVEELSKEYLTLKPGNSFAQNSLKLALKMQGKNQKTGKENVKEEKESHKAEIQEFRRKIYDGKISIKNVSEELLLGFTEFEKIILLAELYSHENVPNKAIQLLKQAKNHEGITRKEKSIILQALNLTNSNNMGIIQRKKQWGQLSGDEGRAEWEI